MTIQKELWFVYQSTRCFVANEIALKKEKVDSAHGTN